MREEEQASSSIVLWQGSPLEKIAATSLLPRDKIIEFLHSRFFLASDVVMGNYGVTGFLIVDTKPEERYESYTDSKLYGVSHSLEHCIHLPQGTREDPIRLSHFINTDKGFKLVRYFLIPYNVKEFFEGDKFLGDPMIRKCCEDGTIPEFFDEELAHDEIFTTHVFSRYDYNRFGGREEGEKLVDIFSEGITPRLREVGETRFDRFNFRHQHYVSFHAWSFYRPVVDIADASLIMTIGNFDKVLLTIDKKGILQRRDLSTQGTQEYRIALPSMTGYPPLST